MGRLRTIARRTFLIGSAAVVGGVVFGTYMVRKLHANPLLDGLGDGEAALTPYVRIDAQGVTLITPRADKGQGAYHAQAVLLAEELDVDLADVRVEPGPPAPAYWNTALAPEAAEFMVPAQGMMRNLTEGALGSVMKVLGIQVTGGSTTIPDGFDKLRAAGASARETLKSAAAEMAGVNTADLSTEAGHVVLPDGSRVSYADLATKAAEIDPVTDVPLKTPDQWRLIGHPTQRLDIVAKSTGTQAYGIDAEIDGMVHAAVLLNPAQTGPINGYDDSEARQMRGVIDIVPITGGVGIVADNTWRAFQAAQAIEADWGPAPFPATMEAHWDTLAASFTDAHLDSTKRDDGDVEAALAEAEDVLETEYRVPYAAHAPLEPINAVVRVDDDAVEVWTGTQIPRFIQANIAKITGIDADKVTVHVAMMGGSFGHRLEDEVVKQATEIAMQMKGTPVKLTYSREEDMLHDFPRQIAVARMRGTVKEGQVDTLDLGIAMPSVTVSQLARQGQPSPGPDSQIVAGAWNAPHDIPNQRVRGYRAPELAPISSWRSVGAASNGFLYNAALDELIHKAGADPLEERLRLSQSHAHARARAVLEAVAEMSDWQGPLGNGRGRGVALTESFGVPCAEIVEVTNSDSGIRIENVWVAAEVGTIVDPVNFENQVMGGVIWGLGHAMNCEITYTDGVADQDNYHAFEGMRLYQTPEIHVRGLEIGNIVRGIGEPSVPPAAPALASAIFAATGIRLREMPFANFVEFV